MRCDWIPDSSETARAMWRSQWVPHPRQSVTEWAEANLTFSSRFTSSPGPFRVRSYPYMREWLDAFHPASGVRSMALLCGAQVAKSTALQVGMAYRLVRAPAPALWVLDTQTNAQSFSESRWQIMIDDNEVLRREMPRNKDKFKNLDQAFQRMHLWFIGSNSPGNLAGRSISLLCLDEVDKYKTKTKQEAAAVQLAIQRTASYPMALVVQTSTPTTEEGSIWRAWTDGDQRRYWVPCPHCTEPMTFSWSLMKWDEDAKDSEGRWDLQRVRSTAHIQCPKCEGKIVDSMKTKMLREGRWIASNPNCLPGHRSYHLPALYSVRRSFGALAVKFLQDKQSLMGLQDFVNSILAEPWVEDADKEQEVKASASDYMSGDRWDEAEFSAMTVDVQDAGGRHFWCVIRDWSKDGRSRGRFAGRIETWDDLEKLREEHEIRHTCVFVDSAFASREVYFACCRFGYVALRGSDNESFTWNDQGRKVQRAYARPERGDPAGGGRWDAGTLARRTCPLIKFSAPTCEDILDALRRADPVRWEFPKDFPLDWHEHMASTVKKRTRNAITGAVKAQWVVVKGRPNHLRDCEKMQVVAALLAKVLTPSAERPKEKATP